MKHHIRTRANKQLILPALIALFTCSFVFFFSNNPVVARNPNERLISIYDGETTQTVVTTATTIQEVLAKTNITLAEHDTVEPGLGTQLVSTDYNVNIYRARPVTVVDGTTRKTIMTPYQSPQKIADSAGVKTYPEDNLEITRVDDFLSEDAGLRMNVDRAVAMNLVLYGEPLTIRTQAATVGELFEERGVVLGANDGSSLPADTLITAGMELKIWRNGVQTVNQEQVVAFPVEQIKDATKDVGYREIRSAGTPGKKIVTYEINMQNGQEVSRKEIQSTISVQPVKQVEVVGTKAKAVDGDFASALARLRGCEAGGNYANKRNPTYRGAYQFSYSTWANYGGYYDPADAPPEVQDQAAQALYKRRGWQPWPGCTAKLGLQDIYR